MLRVSLTLFNKIKSVTFVTAKERVGEVWGIYLNFKRKGKESHLYAPLHMQSLYIYSIDAYIALIMKLPITQNLCMYPQLPQALLIFPATQSQLIPMEVRARKKGNNFNKQLDGNYLQQL